MYTYGRKWQEALHRILMRLASNHGYAFLVIEGPDASGKTDLLTLVSHIAEDASAIQELPNQEFSELGQLIHTRNYLQICLEDAEEGDSIPISIFKKTINTISKSGVPPGKPLLIMWDNIDKCLNSSLHQHQNHEFLEELHRSLEGYDLAFLCTVTAPPGGGSEVLGTSAGPEHFLEL